MPRPLTAAKRSFLLDLAQIAGFVAFALLDPQGYRAFLLHWDLCVLALAAAVILYALWPARQLRRRPPSPSPASNVVRLRDHR